MSHIYHEESTDSSCDLRETLEVDSTRISRSTSNDKTWLSLVSELVKFIVVDSLSLVIKTVRNEVEEFTGNIYR